MAEARKERLPVTPDDLRPHPPIPDGQNAGLVYQKLESELGYPISGEPLYMAIRGVENDSAFDSDRALVRKKLAQLKPTLDALVKASKLPGCDFHWKFEQGPDMVLPEISTLLHAGRYLCLRAHTRSAEGNAEGALADIAAAVRMAGQVATLPTLICLISASDQENGAMKEFKYLIERNSRDPAVLGKARKALAAFPAVANVRTSLGAQVAHGLTALDSVTSMKELLRMIGTAQGSSEKTGSKFDVQFSDSFRAELKIRHLKLWLKIMRGIPKAGTWAELNDGLYAGDVACSKLEDSKEIEDQIVVLLTPTMYLLAGSVGQEEAERHVAATAIHLMLDRLANGKYPDNLPAYGPTATDPVDGAPLRYQKSGSSFTLYSIGRDQKDNGGREGSSGFKRDGYDDVWTFGGK